MFDVNANRSVYGNLNTVVLSSTQFKGMSVKLTMTERGMSPRNLTNLAVQTHLRYMRKIAQLMVYTARALAPTSHGDGQYHANSLTDSIVALNNLPHNGVYSFTIGVDGNHWNSDYDERYMKRYRRNPPWGTLKGNKNAILYLLHDHWKRIVASIEEAHERALAGSLGKRDANGDLKRAVNRSYGLDRFTAKQRAQLKKAVMMSYYPEVGEFLAGLEVGERFLYNAVLAVWQKGATSSKFKHFFQKTMNMNNGLLMSRNFDDITKVTGALDKDKMESSSAYEVMAATAQRRNGDYYIKTFTRARVPNSWLYAAPKEKVTASKKVDVNGNPFNMAQGLWEPHRR